MSKIERKWITNGAIDADKLDASVAGDGLTGGAGDALSVSPDATGGANLAKAINVSANGVAVKVDGSTVGENASGQIEVKNGGITGTQLNSSVAGNGLDGGAGTALSVSPDTTGGANLASVVNVSINGVAIKVDDTTIGENASGQLGIIEGGITATDIDQTDDFTWSGAHSFTAGTITVPTPVSNTQAANKAYVDAVAQGLDVKGSVVAISTGNITLSGEQTIDGVSIVSGNRVLVAGQTGGITNGIYVASATAWARSADFATDAAAAGFFCFVEDGTNYKDCGFVCTNNSGSDIVGTNALTFTQFSGAGSYQAGIGLSLDGNTFNVNLGAGIKQQPTDEIGIDLATISGLTIGAGGSADQLAILPDTTTGVTVAPINLTESGAGVKVDNDSIVHSSGTLAIGTDGVNETHIDFGSGSNQVDSSSVPVDTTFTPANYTPSITYAGITNHLKGIDTAIAGVSTESFKQIGHTITAGENTAGYINISGWANIPANAQSVRITPVGGPEQGNYAIVNALGVTPDFEVSLTSGSERIIINAAGSPTVALSGDLLTGDNLVISYIA